jgi:hypothetical protein
MELGLLKLDGIFDEALFLAPKVYALKNNKEIIKIKGLNEKAILFNKITLSSLEPLLNKDHKIPFDQYKSFKNINNANISILKQVYTLQVTGNKRELVYNKKDNKLVNTIPFSLSDGKIF